MTYIAAMPKEPNHFGICPLCTEVNPYGSEIVSWQRCEEGEALMRPRTIRCGSCTGLMPVEDWKPASGRGVIRLKTWPEAFEDVLAGRKPYDIRRNDRDFQLGDQLILCEYEPHKEVHTGREIHCTVIHITYGGKWGLPKGHCVMGIMVLPT